MDILSEKNMIGIKFTPEAKANLATISQWANINAIVGFISLGITLIGSIRGFMLLSRFGGSFLTGFSLLSVIITLGISLLLNITLFTAAKNIRNGVTAEHQETFNFGMRKFKSYFLIVGILVIIVDIIGFLVLLLALATAARS